MTKLLVATQNQDKLAEIARILSPIGVEPISLTQAGVDFSDVEESGATFEENARIKALAAFKRGGLPAIGDDSGLAVDALGGAPGIYSARYAGEGASSAERNQKLLHALGDIPPEQRTARFVCAICCILSDGSEITARGTCEGSIAFTPRGRGGFGYDPIFLLSDGRTFAELTDAEKDDVSHRGRALQQLAEKLAQHIYM